MAFSGAVAASELRDTLCDASVQCSDRCLYQSAKWAAELSLSIASASNENGYDTEPDSSMEDAEHQDTASTSRSKPALSSREARLETRERPRYLLARSYFQCREFERCAAVFLPSGLPKKPMPGFSTAPTPVSSNTKQAAGSSLKLPRISRKSLFLSLYAKYMSGEKRKEESSEMILGPQDKPSAENPELVNIQRLLEQYFAINTDNSEGDGWLEYLYGLVLAKGKSEKEARAWLIKSVHLYPYQWGAWQELSDLLDGVEDLQQISPELPRNLMTFIFSLYANQMLYQSTEHTSKDLAALEQIFPSSLFLRTQKALLCYHARDFDEAEALFSGIVQEDPHRIDSLDHYSNILYVMRARPKLAFLAQLASATDKFRPETCCVVGNYYSLKSEHEKAVNYFRRALMLDRNFLSAWTLMGHEFVEMKNTHAAIESYRRAVDVNRKDYRAWYGLGQTYEILEMHLYALFYYQRAASLRPYDSTMWSALGSCYDKVGRPQQSIKAYKRALVAGSYYDASSSFGSGATEGTAPDAYAVSETLYSIALMYEKLGETIEAANYMEMTLAQEEGQAAEDEGMDDRRDGEAGIGVTTTTSKARMWLARWEFQKGAMRRAMELANELCQDGVEVEEAKALIRDIRARMEAG